MDKKELKHAFLGDNVLITVGKKLAEWGAIVTAVWFFGAPAAEDYVDDRIAIHDQERREEEGKQTPFRVLLSQEMGVPSDRVHIVIGQMKHNMDAALDSVQKFNNTWIPYLQDEKNTIRPQLIIRDGRPWWLAEDGLEYQVENGFYYKDGDWKPIFR